MDIHELEQSKAAIQDTIRDYIRAIMTQTTQPGVVNVFTRCLGLVAPQQANDAAALLPDPVHEGRNCPNEARHTIVTHDIKKAIIRFWELCKQGETTGLRECLDRLRDHALHDWKTAGTLLGTEPTGYHIFYGQAKPLPDPRDGMVTGDPPDTPPETGPAPAADQAAFKKEADGFGRPGWVVQDVDEDTPVPKEFEPVPAGGDPTPQHHPDDPAGAAGYRCSFEPVPDDPETEDPETGADPPVDPEAGLDPKDFNIDGEPMGGPPPFHKEDEA